MATTLTYVSNKAKNIYINDGTGRNAYYLDENGKVGKSDGSTIEGLINFRIHRKHATSQIILSKNFFTMGLGGIII